MDPLGLVPLARTLIDIDSTTGDETAVADWLAGYLTDLGYRITRQPVEGERFNVLAELDGPASPAVALSTHCDCVPPFMPSRFDGVTIHGRGACDAKGILAAQIVAAERLRAAGETRVALLIVVGEEAGSAGALAANRLPTATRYLINGEPTGNRLATATRGSLHVRIRAAGRAAHSSRPELGVSAIDRLVEALTTVRTIEMPTDPVLGRTTSAVTMISGGVAHNVIPAEAEAQVCFRTVGDTSALHACLADLPHVQVETVTEVPAATMATVPGFETAAFAYTTDVPLLSAWGTPLLFGPGGIEVAHTDEEHVSVEELERGVEGYVALVTRLLA